MGFLAFLAGPWGALIQKALLVVAVAGLIYIGITQYNHNIREGQMLRDQNAQLIQVAKDNHTLQVKLDNLGKINNDILIKLDQKNGKVIETHDKVTNYIASPEAQKSNRGSSDILKNTIGILRNEK
jgi:hypothetical protein